MRSFPAQGNIQHNNRPLTDGYPRRHAMSHEYAEGLGLEKEDRGLRVIRTKASPVTTLKYLVMTEPTPRRLVEHHSVSMSAADLLLLPEALLRNQWGRPSVV